MAATSLSADKGTFEIRDHQFLLNGKPFQIIAGEMHYARIPEAYWRHRLRMARAMGLNTVAVYVMWNYHETERGKFNFKGNADVAKFVRTAKEEGLYVILRPGPYVCAEWDFGGYPYWLLTEPNLVVRSNNKPFLDYAARFMRKLGEQLTPLQITRGGNILMVQVENEYGSYGSDKAFMAASRDMERAAGFDVPLYTADGGTQMAAGHIDGALPGYNGGFGADLMATVDKFAPGGPYMVPEFYPGWLCHWGEKFPRVTTKSVNEQFEWYLKNKVSVSFYMFHGGTNFGFWNGANYGGNYQPHITSYDYDAPLSEAGFATPKFMALRATAQRYVGALPDVPAANLVVRIPRFALLERAALMDNLPQPIKSETIKPMEAFGQGYGFILYRTTVGGSGKLTLNDVRDFAVVMLNGKTVGTLDRRHKEKTLELPSSGQLDILVENWGRINYGGELPTNLKGITESVVLDGKELKGWEVFNLPLSTVQGLKTGTAPATQPTFFNGAFDLDEVGDTWIDTRGWTKGVVWVNGHNLGRYFWIGPQQALYCPGPWLKKGKNEIVVFEMKPTDHHSIEGIDHEVLDDARSEAPPLPKRPKLDHEPQPTRAELVATGEFLDVNAEQTVALGAEVKARYVCFEAVASYRNQDFASLAELWLADSSGRKLDRSKWKVIYTDSEETLAEDGSADNLIDNDPSTIWHSVWSVEHPHMPHRVVIDLGETMSFANIRVLPRQGSRSGNIRAFQLFASDKPF